MFSSASHSDLDWDKNTKVCHEIWLKNSLLHIYETTQYRLYNFWRRGDQQSNLNHLEVNINKITIQKIIIMFWVKEFQKMFHFIITNWLYWIAVWMWNWFRVGFNSKLWRVNLNITTLNGMFIKSPHDSWNHRTIFCRRVPGFEVRFWRLSVPLSWWLIWSFTMKGVELIHLYSKTCWG